LKSIPSDIYWFDFMTGLTGNREGEALPSLANKFQSDIPAITSKKNGAWISGSD
jgi:hypothetical protein